MRKLKQKYETKVIAIDYIILMLIQNANFNWKNVKELEKVSCISKKIISLKINLYKRKGYILNINQITKRGVKYLEFIKLKQKLFELSKSINIKINFPKSEFWKYKVKI